MRNRTTSNMRPDYHNYDNWADWEHIQDNLFLARTTNFPANITFSESCQDWQPTDSQRLAMAIIAHKDTSAGLAYKFRVMDVIEECTAPDGLLYVNVWQMDCDCASWTTLHKISPTWAAYDQLKDDVYDGAEGSVRFTILDPDEVKEWRPEHRDHALEAFENGHPHFIQI